MAAGQSRSASLFETLTSTVVGFILSVAVQRALFPAMGHDFAFTENILVASVFTAVSILRGYAIRRTFNALRDQLPRAARPANPRRGAGWKAIAARRRGTMPNQYHPKASPSAPSI